MKHVEIDQENIKATHEEEIEQETSTTPIEEISPALPSQDEWKEKYIRLYAEFDNTKKRFQRDQLNWHLLANKKLILDLLPTLDDLERALQNLNQTQNDAQDTHQGITLILTNLRNQLEAQGLKAMEVEIGQEANPQEHHILTKVDTAQEALKGKITEVVTKGYLLNGHVIRHAQVTIGA